MKRKKKEEESKEEKKKRKKKEEKSKRYGFLWVFMDYFGYLYRFLWICIEKSNHKCDTLFPRGPVDHRQPVENLCVSYPETHT